MSKSLNDLDTPRQSLVSFFKSRKAVGVSEENDEGFGGFQAQRRDMSRRMCLE
jgi:hypothetical protein